MPYMVEHGEVTAFSGVDSAKNHEYSYPEGLNLHPSSEQHNFILARLIRYGLESSKLASHRYKTWNGIDDKLTGFIATDDEEKRVQAKDKRKPVSIVFPYSYAILETLVSYLVAAFLPEPTFRYEGTGPEDIAGATLLQHVIAQHVARNKIALNLHTLFRDACAYGFGVVSPQWTVRLGTRMRKDTSFVSGLDGNPLERRRVRQEDNAILFEGNSLINIDPYCYLPDPAVPIHDVQRGEFVGWMDRTNYMDLLTLETEDSDLFNVKYLRHLAGKSSSILGLNKQSRFHQRGHHYDIRTDRMISDPIDLFHVYVKLIPKQWKLGSSEVPEKWLFTVAGDSIIIQAKPLGLHHNLFPVCVCAPDFDGYSPIAYSRLEILSGMQTTIDWLFNSHIANVRKAVNDVLIVDPTLINMNDLKDPGAGGFVRMRRAGYGKGVKDAVMQLNITDITRQNIGDVAAIIQYMQTIGGTDSPVMGSLRQGGPDRLSAREFQGTAQGAVSRLERVAKIVGIQAMQDIGYMFAYHTQQLMTQPVYLQTVGTWPEKVRSEFGVTEGRVLADPYSILVDYDLKIRDGSVPGGNFSDVWVQLFQIIGSNELLTQRFDIVRIFKHIASNLGAKNVDDFEIQQPSQITTAPDDLVAQQVAQGNLSPI